MERLTERVNGVVVYTKGKSEIGTLPVEMKSWDVREVLYKLAEYEDAEEQGLLKKIVHGEWIKLCGNLTMFFKCNKCGSCNEFATNFCPNCGAKMDGKEEGVKNG